MQAQSIDHICIAVKDLNQARRQYEGILGLTLHGLYEAPSESIRVARYYLGQVALELMEPMNDACEVARFLRSKGEGVFLISYRVPDVQAGLDELRAKGYTTIDQAPRKLMGNRYAFLTPPKDTCGVLSEIVDGGFDGSYGNPTTD
ncbi:MAG: VOC family protein [Desulfarculus sp.]|nr:VOC family protein [Desulfarculus sp.]